MFKCVLGIGIFWSCLFLAVPGEARASPFRVEKIQLCSEFRRSGYYCNAVSYHDGYIKRSILREGKIFAIVTIRCEHKGILFLKENEFLPVNILVSRDGKPNISIPLSIKQEDYQDHKDIFFMGPFSWRLNFYIIINDASTIEFSVLDGKNYIVPGEVGAARYTLNFN